MRNVCFKKGLVVGIIVLFLGVSALPIVTSKSISSPFEMLVEHGAESDDNDKPLKDYKEVITIFKGTGYGHTGEYLGFFGINLFVFGGPYSIFAITRNPLRPFYFAKACGIHMKIFFGVLFYGGPGEHRVQGFAFGDISWEPYE